MKYAVSDIKSYNRSILYASMGDEVEILHENGHVLICESKRGRFPCTIERLSDTAPTQPEEILRAPKTNDKDQLNLFGL